MIFMKYICVEYLQYLKLLTPILGTCLDFDLLNSHQHFENIHVFKS